MSYEWTRKPRATNKVWPGIRFGKLVVRRRTGTDVRPGGTIPLWECVCDCGKVCIVRGTALRKKETRSCGCMRDYQKNSPDAPLNEVIAFYKVNAKLRSIQFQLSKEEFRTLITKNCHWCGDPPSIFRKTGFAELLHGGVDRLDPNKDYTVENCVPSCKVCNWMKSNLGVSQFIEHLHKIVRRHIDI